LLASLSALLFSPIVHAADGEKLLSFTPSFAMFTVSQGTQQSAENIDAVGGAMLVEYEHGVTDTLWIRGAVAGGAYGAGGLGYSASGVLGITYAIDILKYVPYINLGVGAIHLRGGSLDTDTKMFIELGVGLDILRSRSFSYGVVARFDSFASELAFFMAGLRATWRWGTF
jgi:hypothetical protein